MGPFVPDLISDQLNLVVALLLGIGFGFVLEQAGFSSSRRLAGVFYGYDFTVLRVFFTAAVTAMSGVLLLSALGLLDTDAIYVNPTWLVPAIVGGAIMGVGFILGGYCPGTSVCAAAIGKVDAMFFVGGGLLGVLAFGELFPLYEGFYHSSDLGAITVFQSLGMTQGMFAFALIVVAVGAFAVTSRIEKKVDPTGAPSLQFPVRAHRMAAAGILLLGVVFLVLPDRKTALVARVSDPGYIAAHPTPTMTVDELAFRIVDNEPNIRIIDLRKADAFAAAALPGSLNAKPRDFFGKDWIAVLSPRHMKKVIVADKDQDERAAVLLLQDLGYENCVALDGGYNAFDQAILHPTGPVATGSRWDADVNAFRAGARVDILKKIEDGKHAVKAVKTTKKIQGGC